MSATVLVMDDADMGMSLPMLFWGHGRGLSAFCSAEGAPFAWDGALDQLCSDYGRKWVKVGAPTSTCLN